MKKQHIWMVAALALLVLFGFMVKTNLSSKNTEENMDRVSEQATQPSSSGKTDEAIIIGDRNAKLKIVEYVDYKCSNCNKFHRTIMPELQRDYIDTGKASIEVRLLPYFGLDASKAADGAYCALDQGKFQDYNDNAYDYIWQNLFSKGGNSSDEIFTAKNLSSVAQASNLDVPKFDKCVAEKTFDDLVKRDLKSSADQQVSGTPTFLIGDQRIIGIQPYSIFRSLIEQQLQERQ